MLTIGGQCQGMPPLSCSFVLNLDLDLTASLNRRLPMLAYFINGVYKIGHLAAFNPHSVLLTNCKIVAFRQYQNTCKCFRGPWGSVLPSVCMHHWFTVPAFHRITSLVLTLDPLERCYKYKSRDCYDKTRNGTAANRRQAISL